MKTDFARRFFRMGYSYTLYLLLTEIALMVMKLPPASWLDRSCVAGTAGTAIMADMAIDPTMVATMAGIMAAPARTMADTIPVAMRPRSIRPDMWRLWSLRPW